LNEFELIRRYFSQQPVTRSDVLVGVGDDAAVMQLPGGMQLVTTSDVLVEGVHFPPETAPADIGYKSLAVNLSDLAAMGAEPAWFTLNLSLPEAAPEWLEGFCAGMFALAARYQVQLVGGDTVRGPLTIGVQAHGLVPAGGALLRSGAKAGDRVYLSGTVGDAGLGLLYLQGELPPGDDAGALIEKLNRPAPRVELGIALRGIASSAIDVSDGLVADLGHILRASAVGARISLDRVPLSPAYRARFERAEGWTLALTNGDDYELCFTVPAGKEQDIARIQQQCFVELSWIGEIAADAGLHVVAADGSDYAVPSAGHDHFATH